MTVLEFDSVTKVYSVRGAGQMKALDDVSFTLSSGQTIGLVGQSGSGKSTIAKILTQLEVPTSGEVRLDGSPIPRRGRGLRAYRQRLRMVFQDPFASLNPYHSIRYAIQRPLQLDAVVPPDQLDDEVRRLLGRVRLDADAVIDRRPHELSGGQRQRVAIARALASRPRLLVADEPVSMLDVSIRVSLLNTLGRLRDELDVGFLFITHDLAVAKYFAWDGEIAVMYLGKVVEHGPTPEVIGNPQHPYTKALIGAVCEPDPDLARANRSTEQLRSAEIPSLHDLPAGCAFHPRCPAFEPGLCDGERPLLQLASRRDVACHVVARGREQVDDRTLTFDAVPGSRRPEPESAF